MWRVTWAGRLSGGKKMLRFKFNFRSIDVNFIELTSEE